jgi:hypothetical protein
VLQKTRDQQKQQQVKEDREGLLPAGNPWAEEVGVMHHQQQQSPDEFFVVEVLKGLPGLQLLRLDKCRVLVDEGQALARHSCGRYSPAVVAYR